MELVHWWRLWRLEQLSQFFLIMYDNVIIIIIIHDLHTIPRFGKWPLERIQLSRLGLQLFSGSLLLREIGCLILVQSLVPMSSGKRGCDWDSTTPMASTSLDGHISWWWKATRRCSTRQRTFLVNNCHEHRQWCKVQALVTVWSAPNYCYRYRPEFEVQEI